jgi:hypothetical protein
MGTKNVTFIFLVITSGGANCEEDISDFVYCVIFLVISCSILYQPSDVYEEKG